MNHSSLHNIYLENNAEFTIEAGWELPKKFHETEKEVNDTRNGISFIDISHRGKIVLSGKEHIKFLQGMLSNDINSLDENDGLYATLLTVKGRMVSDMRVFKDCESIYLDLEPGLNNKIFEHLLKFRLSYKADIEDVTDNYSLFHICGPKINNLKNKDFISTITRLKENSFVKLEIENIPVRAFKVNRTGETGFDLMVKIDDAEVLWSTINKLIKPQLIGLDCLETLRIESGIPIYNKDMDESTIPIEAGLWNALDFEKGCYIGQEVIARIKWRGHVNRHLMGFISNDDQKTIEGNSIISNEKEIGKITSSIYSPTLSKNISMGYIRREFVEPGTRVSALDKDNNKSIEVTVQNLPFYNNFN